MALKIDGTIAPDESEEQDASFSLLFSAEFIISAARVPILSSMLFKRLWSCGAFENGISNVVLREMSHEG